MSVLEIAKGEGANGESGQPEAARFSVGEALSSAGPFVLRRSPMSSSLPPMLARLVGREVVLDVSSAYVYLGRLAGGDEKFLALEDADVHDLRDTATTREEYVLAARRHGLAPNRARVYVRTAEVVSVSALGDVIA
jgi:hypothetical protein